MPLPLEKERYEFAQFLCMSDEQKYEAFGYKTQYEFSADKGVTQKTLSTWKNDKKFQKLKNDTQLSLWDDRLSNVVEATYLRAVRDGDVSAQTQFYKLVGVTKDRVETTSNSDIQYILSSVISILQEEITDKKVLNSVSAKLLELADDL